MSKLFNIALAACLLTTSQVGYADTYPKNLSVDIIHYAFDLKLSDLSNEIKGKTTISFLTRSDNIRSIRLDLINRSEKFSNKGMIVDRVSLGNVEVKFTHKNDALIIEWSTALKKDAKADLSIEYHGIPAGGLKIGPTKFGDRSFFNENWPNNTRHWLPCIDHPYDKATSEFRVTAPRHYKVVSNGLLLEESNIDKEYNFTHWKQSVPVSSWLFVLGVAEFAVQRVGTFDGKEIQTWVYPKNKEMGFFDFAEPTKQVLEFYSNYVGPFAYEKLANIQSPSVGGGMETSSAIFYGENLITGKYEKRLRNVVIHEIAHQWFGNAVTESTWDDAWLSEGFATFFSMLFQGYAYGHEEFITGIRNARRTVYNISKKDSTYSIVANRSAEKDQVTTGITYQKGAWVLHMLRERIGHDNFRKGIQNYYSKYFNSNATTDNFREEMEKVSGQDLSVFFKQWLYKSENLKLSVAWTYDATAKNVMLTIKQIHHTDLVFDFPLELEIHHPETNSSELMKFNINQKETVIPIKYDKNPSSIRFDPRTVLLAEIDIIHPAR